MIVSTQLRKPRGAEGFTLVELSLVTALTSVLLGLALGLMISLRQADRTIRTAQDGPRERARLAQRLRADIHAASDYRFDEEGPALVLEMAGRPDDGSDQAVVYQSGSAGRWERRKGRGEDAQLTDAFHLAGAWHWRVERAPGAGGRCIRATWSTDGDDPPGDAGERSTAGRARRWEVVAMLGRDHPGVKP